MIRKAKNVLIKHLNKKRAKHFCNVTIKNRDVTILCNNCLAGCIYHDLKLEFLSPTINTFISVSDFITFVEHYGEYSSKGFIKELEDSTSYPLGELCCSNLPSIKIHFVHYKTFKEAVDKWLERTKRINPKKIFCIISSSDKINESIIEKAKEIKNPYIILSSLPTNKQNQVLHMPFFDKYGSRKPITSFYGLSGKKGYDSFDFANCIFNHNYN